MRGKPLCYLSSPLIKTQNPVLTRDGIQKTPAVPPYFPETPGRSFQDDRKRPPAGHMIMPSSLITVDGTGQVYFEVCPHSPVTKSRRQEHNYVSVGGSGGIFRVLGASAHTCSDSLGAFSTPTLLLQRLYTVKYIMSDIAKSIFPACYRHYYALTTANS